MADFRVEIVESPALEVIVELAGAGSSAGVSSYNALTDVPTTFPPSSHEHSATEITSGTLDDARIPSGVARDAEVASAVTAHEALPDPHPVYLTQAEADALYKALGYVPDWAEITGKPSTFAPIIGSGAADAVAGNDSRLTDTRTPTDGSVTNAKVNASAAIAESKLSLASDAAAGTASRRTLGTSATSAAAGNDSRLSDTRTPTDSSVTNAKVDAAAAIAESKLTLASDAAAGTASRRTLGTGATQAAAGDHTHAGLAYRTLVTLGSDVSNSTSTFADVTGLSFAVTSGTIYRFEIMVFYTSQATTTGSMFSVNGPATPTMLSYRSVLAVGTSTTNQNEVVAYDSPTTASSTSANASAGNIATIAGIIQPSSSGTLVVRFKSEAPGTNNQITAKAGSTLEYW